MRLIKYILLIFLLSLTYFSKAQEAESKTPGIRFRITAGVSLYKAFSQNKNSMVMKMGYPVFEGMQLQMGGGISLSGEKAPHHLNLNALHVPVMSSDDGLGNNFLLQKKNSNMASIQLEYPGTKMMSEGYAVWLDNSCGRKDINQYIRNFKIKYPEYMMSPTQLLNETFDDEMNYYPNAGVLIHFWIRNYGVEKINRLFSVSKDDFKKEFEDITRISWNEMEAEYNKYLKTI